MVTWKSGLVPPPSAAAASRRLVARSRKFDDLSDLILVDGDVDGVAYVLVLSLLLLSSDR